MLIDNRANEISDIRDAVAATAIGTASELAGAAREKWLRTYAERHPHLSDFAASEATALCHVTVAKYILVSRFQNVVEISP
jgi:hypothetical protein